MAERPPARDAIRVLEVLAIQLERDRRAFLWGSAVYVGGNLVLAGLAWALGGASSGLPAAIAFLGNVFYALTAEWELRWRAIWRRELPRLERETGIEILSRVAGTGAGLGRWMRMVSWVLTAVWLAILLLAIREAGWLPSLAGSS